MKVYVRAKPREISLSVFKPKLLEAYLKKVNVKKFCMTEHNKNIN